MDKVKVAIIGCGGIGNFHASHLIEMEDVSVVAVADLIEERRTKFSKMFDGARMYANHKELYDNEKDLDAVYICLPPYAHTKETEIPFIKRGCAMYIEKPMALDLALAREVRDEIARAGIVNTVGFQLRYLSFLDKAKEYIKRENPLTIYANRIGGLPGVAWFNLYSQSGGQTVEQNIHTIDMLRYLFGEVTSVYGIAGNTTKEDDIHYDIDDHSSALLTFKSGVVVNVNTGCYIPPAPKSEGEGLDLHIESATQAPDYNHIMMIGKNSVAQCNYFSKFSQWDNQGNLDECVDDRDSGVLADRAFIDAVKANNPYGVMSPYVDAYKTLEAVLAMNASFRTGEVIKL